MSTNGRNTEHPKATDGIPGSGHTVVKGFPSEAYILAQKTDVMRATQKMIKLCKYPNRENYIANIKVKFLLAGNTALVKGQGKKRDCLRFLAPSKLHLLP